MIQHCAIVASARDDCNLAKLSCENLSSNAGINVPMWSTSGISPTPSESVCSGYSSPEEGSPEDAFMQRCQQQIARIVAASSGDGLDPQLPMLTRIGQLPPGAHVRLAGAHARLASSLCTVPEPRSLAVNMANELAARSSKRDWQVAGAADLSLSAMWHKASAAKRARPDDWVPAAPEMLQPELSLALGELAGAHDCRCARLPLRTTAAAHDCPCPLPHMHTVTSICPCGGRRLLRRGGWPLHGRRRLSRPLPVLVRGKCTCMVFTPHGREACVERCSRHATAAE